MGQRAWHKGRGVAGEVVEEREGRCGGMASSVAEAVGYGGEV